MGLDTSHGAWHGAYSAFNRWRGKIAEVAGLPPLEIMEGFYSKGGSFDPLTLLNYKYPKGDELDMFRLRGIFSNLPIKWSCLKPNPLHELLCHSDCDGYINWSVCKKIADELSKLIDKLPDEDNGGHIGNWREKTQTFIDGLMNAYNAKEKLVFH